MPRGLSDGVSDMEVSFTTLPREISLSLSPMPNSNLNRILSAAVISTASLSLKPMPAFAKISHPELVNFEVQEIQALCYSTQTNRPQIENEMKDHPMWRLDCLTSPPPSLSFLDSSPEIPAGGKLPDQGESAKKLFVDSKLVVYEDIIVGTGQPINDPELLKVNFHYDFYESSERPRRWGNYGSKKNSKRKPEEIYLCKHNFGKGFEKGMQGMREGGIRKIFVPKEFSPGENPGAFYVELLQVCPSVQCHIRNKFP
uniref:Rotamase n=1 Tax=Manihot esculenta TaxID=3983 RepID=A0A199U9R6_MANES